MVKIEVCCCRLESDAGQSGTNAAVHMDIFGDNVTMLIVVVNLGMLSVVYLIDSVED